MIKEQCIKWIQDWFQENGVGCNAIIGISGGKDSTVVAALCVEALGKDRVIGVLIPDGEQKDIEDAYDVVKKLDIKSYTIDIHGAIQAIENQYYYGYNDVQLSPQAIINLPPRIRMATLYMVSQCNNGRVANTCNLSEDWIGYSTKYGDSAGDFAPLGGLTKTEVVALGKELGLPYHLVHKAPSDGLCGKTDEDNLGFTYDVLDKYIRTGEINDIDIKEKIDRLHKINEFKMKPIPYFEKEN